MTIKKPMKAPAPASDAAAPATGGATIADRFKLDMTEPAKRPAAGGPASTVAAVAGLLALAVAGILTYILWQHWEFLMPA
ncbi:MAG: hypothetical protein KBT68_08665 [bacterium]|nr:hypothetical protein [Candidatus Colisoma equi]